MNWEEQLGLKFTAFIAGLVGGIISLTYETKLSFIRALTLIFVGGVTAGYSFSAIEHYFNISNAASGIFGFGIGLTSMRLVDTLISIVDLIRKDPTVILSIPKILADLRNVTRNNTVSGGADNIGSSDILTARKRGTEGREDS